MSHALPLQSFIDEASRLSRANAEPSDAVLAIAPLMMELAAGAGSFLEPQQRRSDPEHHARNLVYDAPDGSLSLYALVWLPGQWTPVHDHGSWGVVGVAEGVPVGRSPAVTLHLYGRTMSSFNIYDVAAGTRRRIEVAHNES